ILHTTVANATFFATTAPVWVVVFGWLFERRRVGVAALLGLGLCLLGGFALIGQSFAVAPDRLLGDGLAAVAGVFFGGYFLAVERSRERQGAAAATFQMTVVAAGLLAIVACWAWLELHQRFWPAGLQGWAVLCALGVVSHAGGQGLLAIALG